MCDGENSNKEMRGYRVESIELVLCNNRPMLNMVSSVMNDKLRGKLITPLIPDFFIGTVWYKVVLDGSLHSSLFKFFGGIYVEYGNYYYYPIPETLNFSEVSCVYNPRLVFGSLSDITLTNFILDNHERPYAAYIPGSNTNLVTIHGSKHMILANWWHDFIHSVSFHTCEPTDVMRLLHHECKSESFMKNDNIGDIYSKIKNCVKTQPAIALDLNDRGIPFKVLNNRMAKGGSKKRRKKASKRKQKRTYKR